MSAPSRSPPTARLHDHSCPLPRVQMPTLPTPPLAVSHATQRGQRCVVAGKGSADPTVLAGGLSQRCSFRIEFDSVQDQRGRLEPVVSRGLHCRQGFTAGGKSITRNLLGQFLSRRPGRHHVRCPEHSECQRRIGSFDHQLGEGRRRGGSQHQPQCRGIHVGRFHIESIQTHSGGPEWMTVSSLRVTARPVETSHDCPRAHFSNAISPVLSAVA